MKLRLYKAVLIVWVLFDILAVAHADTEVPIGSDLQADGRLATALQLPILLAFTAIDCGYCEQLEEEFLEPMLLGGEYAERIIFRKLVLDNGSRLTDFSGQRRTATELSDQYRVFVTPTILFVDSDGKELAARMPGINTPELFGGYLDNCIETAWLNVHGLNPPSRPITCLLNE